MGGNRRRARKLLTAFTAAVVAFAGFNAGAFSPLGPPDVDVAGASYRAPLTGFEHLRRLRLAEPELLAAPTPVPFAVDAPPPPVPLPPAKGDVAIAPPPPKFVEPPPKPVPPPQKLQDPPPQRPAADGGTWAVMVGINDYPGSRYDLRSAVNDANDVNEALARLGVPGANRLLIRNGQATASTIRASVEWLASHAGPDAKAVFFFAGHIRKVSSSTEALVAADGGLVHDSTLASLFDRVPARRAWIVLAGCYSGGFTEVLRSGRILTAAASADQLAYENDQFGRSYLVEYMVRRAMIQNKASSSVEAAFNWSARELRQDHPNRVPVQYDYASGELDLRPPQAKTSSPPPSSSSPPPSSGGSGGGQGSPPPSSPPRDDGCSWWTGGLVNCGE